MNTSIDATTDTVRFTLTSEDGDSLSADYDPDQAEEIGRKLITMGRELRSRLITDIGTDIKQA